MVSTETRVFHPVCSVFPMMTPDEIDRLAADIAAHGQLEPIVVDAEGLIIDGRHRYLACRKAGVMPKRKTWTGAPDDLVPFVLSRNLNRRHLDPSQRAMVAAKLAALPLGANQHAPIGAPSQEQAAELLGVGRRSVQRARDVLDDGAPELAAAVDAGAIAVSAAAELSRLSVDEQRDIISRLDPKAVAEAARELRRARSRAVGHSSETAEWYSPGEPVELGRQLLGGFDLDPASCEEANRLVRAERIYTREDNGLAKAWRGKVWLNWPGGRDEDERSNAVQWAAKLIEEHACGRVTEAVCLVFNAATGAEWFQAFWGHPICFVRGRLRFLRPGGAVGEQPTHSNAVVYLGPQVDRFVDIFSPIGRVVLPAGRASVAVGGQHVGDQEA